MIADGKLDAPAHFLIEINLQIKKLLDEIQLLPVLPRKPNLRIGIIKLEDIGWKIKKCNTFKFFIKYFIIACHIMQLV